MKNHILILLLLNQFFTVCAQIPQKSEISRSKSDMLMNVMRQPSISSFAAKTFFVRYGGVRAQHWGINRYILLQFEKDTVIVKEKEVRTNDMGIEDPESEKFVSEYRTQWTVEEPDKIILQQVQKDAGGEDVFTSNVLRYENGTILANLSHSKNEYVFKPTIWQPKGYITDFEVLFNENQIKELDSLVHDFEKRTTIQIVVVTLDQSYCDKDDFEAYTLQLANTWGVGQKGKDNGILIAISKEYRQMRIHNGKGIENILSDDETKQLIDESFIPKFKENNFFEGTKNGLKALMQTLETKQALQTEVEAFTTELIALIEQKNTQALQQISTDKIYCYLCFTERPEHEPFVNKQNFYSKHFQNIFNDDLVQRLKRNETTFYTNTTDYGDCLILYTTQHKNEFGDGHEGVQLGFWLKEENGKLKLGGIDAIP
ncbi:TPM domain-containing protein [Flavobacterium sp. CBA20B-1]|uniref:TPM domain-containing protein n=1 Tax=unclassified Flavobacterium TaxID=196869 RepID=UPI00222571DD|nr:MULTISPECIES: TPM domain-containing protein [unclassified Flavobacterium]WCM42689.1 TPM domain-containing protein [Flavobacterium sp. CBA20B-1]